MTYSITFALRLIGRNADHSINAATGFALIIAIIISTSGIIVGFSDTIFGLTEQLGYSNRFAIKPDSSHKITKETIEKLEQSVIGSILPLAKKNLNFSTREKTLQTDLIGTNLSLLGEIFTDMELFEGTLPNKSNTPMECLQGIEIRGYLIANELTQIELLNKSLNITGTLTGLAELQQTILIDLEHYATLLGQSLENLQYNETKINTEESLTMEEMRERLTKILGYDFSVWNEQQADVFAKKLREDIYSKLEILFWVLLLIALIRLIHSISWFAIKYERTLLIMRAMGMSKTQLFVMIVLLGQVVGNIGFVLGVIIGYFSPPIILSFMTSILNVDFLVTEYPIFDLLPLWLASVIIVSIATIIPSIKITNTPPSKISMLIMQR